MLNLKSYVPLLRAKRGELRALRALHTSTAESVVPLLELQPDKDLQFDDATVLVPKLAKYWERRAFVDHVLVPECHPSDAPGRVRDLYAEFRSPRITAVPVVRLSDPPQLRAVVAEVARKDSNGVLVRLTVRDVADDRFGRNARSLLRDLSLPVDDCDVLIDLELTPRDQATILTLARQTIPTVAAVGNWRSLVFAGSSFPRMLSAEVGKGVTRLDRPNATAWTKLRRMRSLPRAPTFGDYATQSAARPELGSQPFPPSANIRYTVKDAWLVFRGGSVIRGKRFGQYHSLAAQLVAHPEFCGRGFSAGDEMIDDIARQNSTPGNSETWVVINANHHIEFVVNGLASRNAP